MLKHTTSMYICMCGMVRRLFDSTHILRALDHSAILGGKTQGYSTEVLLLWVVNEPGSRGKDGEELLCGWLYEQA